MSTKSCPRKNHLRRRCFILVSVGCVSFGLLFAGLPAGAFAADNLVCHARSDALAINKRRIADVVRREGHSEEHVLFALAIAMAETEDLLAAQRDDTLDGGPCQKFSCFNLSLDLLQRLGWWGTPDLNLDEHLEQTVGYVLAGWQRWGVDRFLNYHRSGLAGWCDGVSYGAEQYRDYIQQIVAYLRTHPQAQTDCTSVSMARR